MGSPACFQCFVSVVRHSFQRYVCRPEVVLGTSTAGMATMSTATKNTHLKPIYKPCEFPGHNPVLRDIDSTGLSDVTFGQQMKDEEFVLNKHTTFLNHGGYGASPRRVQEVQQQYNRELESHPDMWFRLSAKFYLEQARKEVADFIGADMENVLLVQNATSDHITSPSAIVMPLQRLTSVCHKHGAVVVVDGAQVFGQLPLDVDQLGVDLYISNIHKWGYAPRGCALLWYAPKHEEWLSPLCTSWLMGMTKDWEFFDQGTRDHTPLICARNALQFYEAVGGMEKIVSYTKSLADEAKQMMESELRLEHLDIPESMTSPSMRLLMLPHMENYPSTIDGLVSLFKALFGTSDISSLLVKANGHLCIRYCTQIYNDLDDFKKLTTLLRTFLANQERMDQK